MSTPSTSPPPQLYDDKVDAYAAMKSNPFKVFCEEETFWQVVGDSLRDKAVLDLACGSGHYTRAMRTRGGARAVLGVDVSPAMIGEARKLEEDEAVGGVEYVVADATEYRQALGGGKEFKADVVTAQYLVPYASTREELQKMFDAAFEAIRESDDGRFISITGMSRTGEEDPRFTAHSEALGYLMTWEGQRDDSTELPDGTCVLMTIFEDATRKSGGLSLTFSNYIWSRRTIEAALCDAGFSKVEWFPFQVSEEGKAWAEASAEELRGGWLDNIGFFIAFK